MAFLSALCLAAGLAGSFLAPQQAPPRDRATPAPVGTGVIAGRVTVMDARPAAPVRRACVMLESMAGAPPQIVDSDIDGRFRFDKLPAGAYRVVAQKPGYVTLEHGEVVLTSRAPTLSGVVTAKATASSTTP